MEKKKKEIKKQTENKKVISKNKKELDTKKQSTIFFVIIAIFVLLIFIGILASKNLSRSFGAATYKIKFLGDSGYSIYNNGHYVAPVDDTCETDEYGYLDPNCAYTVACICRRWSTQKSGQYPNHCYDDGDASDCDCIDKLGKPCQGTALYNSDLFTTRFTGENKYYCVYGSSYISDCDVPAPTESCYACEGGSGPVRTINTTRAATMTGVSDSSKCHPVEDEQCNPKPSTEAPKPSTEAPKPSTEAPKPSTEVPKNNCYSCKLGEGKEYEYATSSEEAANKTGGTACVVVSNTNCNNPPKSCYACDTKNGKEYLKTTSKENAEQAGGTNCTIVNMSQCEEIPDNPKTGTAGIIIAWLVGLSALTYSFIYFVKLKKISN